MENLTVSAYMRAREKWSLIKRWRERREAQSGGKKEKKIQDEDMKKKKRENGKEK